MEQELHSERITVERKVFFFDLKENKRGRFLKITEDVGGRRDMIIVPASGLHDFAAAVQTVMQTAKGLPPVATEGDVSYEDFDLE